MQKGNIKKDRSYSVSLNKPKSVKNWNHTKYVVLTQ